MYEKYQIRTPHFKNILVEKQKSLQSQEYITLITFESLEGSIESEDVFYQRFCGLELPIVLHEQQLPNLAYGKWYSIYMIKCM